MLEDDVIIVPKKRGRPVGAIKPAFFVISALDNGLVRQEVIYVTRGEDISIEDMREEACDLFLNKFNINPEKVYGPCFDAVLTQKSSEPKKEVQKFSEEDIKLTNHTIHAERNGWKIIGRYFIDKHGVKREDYVRATHRHEITPSSKKRAKPHDAFFPIAELENIKQISL